MVEKNDQNLLAYVTLLAQAAAFRASLLPLPPVDVPPPPIGQVAGSTAEPPGSGRAVADGLEITR